MIHQKTENYVILLIIVLVTLVGNTRTDKCVDGGSPRVRSFDTLLHLQSNRVSFIANSPNFEGNYVTIEENLYDIGRNSFISFTSKYITKMFLSNRKVKNIEEGAFVSLDCLMVLDLHKNSISKITKRMFEGLPVLRELNFGENNLKEVPDVIFSLLSGLKVLNLTRNWISILHGDAFYTLSHLERLDLSNNYIHTIASSTLKPLQQLTHLQLGTNKLNRIEFEEWDLPKLRSLNLSDNYVESFDTSYYYVYGNSLKELYLDHNYLTQINSYGLAKHFPSISIIDINNNPLSCGNVAVLTKSFNETHVSFIGSSTDGGPNIHGIECNRSMTLYIKKKLAEDEENSTAEEPEAVNTTSTIKNNNTSIDEILQKILVSTKQMSQYSKRITILAVVLFVILIVFVFIDIVIRSDIVNCVLRIRKRARNSNDTNNVDGVTGSIENVCLLRDRN